MEIVLTDNVSLIFNKESDSLILNKLNRVNQFYKSVYGIPDTLVIDKYNYQGKLIKEKFLNWKSSKFNLIINNVEKNPNVASFITYKMFDYDAEIKKINDSIQLNQNIDNLITNGEVFCSWKTTNNYQTNFEFEVDNISRKDKYDNRNIKTVRFDLLITDEFGKKLYRKNDFTLELRGELTPQDYTYKLDGNEQTYFINYGNSTDIGRKLESVRKYAKEHKIISKAIITGVVMNDGSIVK